MPVLKAKRESKMPANICITGVPFKLKDDKNNSDNSILSFETSTEKIYASIPKTWIESSQPTRFIYDGRSSINNGVSRSIYIPRTDENGEPTRISATIKDKSTGKTIRTDETIRDESTGESYVKKAISAVELRNKYKEYLYELYKSTGGAKRNHERSKDPWEDRFGISDDGDCDF